PPSRWTCSTRALVSPPSCAAPALTSSRPGPTCCRTRVSARTSGRRHGRGCSRMLLAWGWLGYLRVRIVTRRTPAPEHERPVHGSERCTDDDHRAEAEAAWR